MSEITKVLDVYLETDTSAPGGYKLTSTDGSTVSTIDCATGEVRLVNNSGTVDISVSCQNSSNAGACETCRQHDGFAIDGKLSVAIIDTSDTYVVSIGGTQVLSLPITHSCSTITITEEGSVEAQGALTDNATPSNVVFCSSGSFTIDASAYRTPSEVSYSWDGTPGGSGSLSSSSPSASPSIDDDTRSVTVTVSNQISVGVAIIRQDQQSVSVSDWPKGTPAAPSVGVNSRTITASVNGSQWTITIDPNTTNPLYVNGAPWGDGDSGPYSWTPTTGDQLQPISIDAYPGTVEEANREPVEGKPWDPWVLVKHGGCNCD